ncbi:ABC transporter substrate-binding protein [Kiloniella sp. b19]|uniref:ABC transporter substrate-binding protein n=1 Tax=Kiloniella sp. GXU_MW_B19 TaxID=3141326 RepID=UPI0031E113E4
MKVLVFLAGLLASTMAWANERTVTDDAGRSVTIPADPQRIVVMHEPVLGIPLIELGIVPVGSYGRAPSGKSLIGVDFIETIFDADIRKPEGIGTVGQISLEKLRSLKPDLILASELDLNKLDQLEPIAPVYIKHVRTPQTSGFNIQKQLAKLFRKEKEFETLQANYRERVRKLAQTLHKAEVNPSYLAVFLTDQINAIEQISGAIQAIEDLGYQRLSLGEQDIQRDSILFVPISSEVFGTLDPDLLVVMNSFQNRAADHKTGAKEALDQITPGWNYFLKPAKENRIVYLDSSKVTTPTIASANHTLDSIEAWLQTSSTNQ